MVRRNQRSTVARSSERRKVSLRHALAALAVIGLTVLGTGVGTANAYWSDCSYAYNCFFPDTEGHGQKWQFQEKNLDLTRFNIYTRSGYNMRVGTRACGYSGVNFSGQANYGRPYNDKENYSGRVIRSNRFVTGTCTL